ncbi:hypothetical protein COCHEDRAFT_1021464, partial [Bipolaris maydis C5]
MDIAREGVTKGVCLLRGGAYQKENRSRTGDGGHLRHLWHMGSCHLFRSRECGVYEDRRQPERCGVVVV